ncbi:MAG: type I glyceraldehyde-3-phosphate dehydrogenase [Sulfitobacter sp.]
MPIRVAINGFGRIGRNVLRAVIERGNSDLQVVAINDLSPLETSAHLFEFDSVHGRFGHPVETGPDWIDVGTGRIRYSAERAPDKLAWDDVDIALECTGFFRGADEAGLHLKNGAKRVLISAPGKEGIKTIVYGVNHGEIAAGDVILSNASCTTNCLVPVAHVLDREFGIRRGFMTTVHSYTGTQSVHDRAHDDLYRARAAGLSMIPTTTGAAETLGAVLPHLAGAIHGTAIRVPTPNVSCIDLVVELDRAVTEASVNGAMQAAAEGALAGILGVTERKLVSIDFNHDPRSAIFAADQTEIRGGNMLRVLAWYDNEWGFSNRMLDTAMAFARTL